MKFCLKCGTGLRPEAKFCPACGTAIPLEPPPPIQSTHQQPANYFTEEPFTANPLTDNPGVDGGTFASNTSLLQRVINILIKPKQEWQLIARERPDKIKLLFGYACVLALIPAFATFIKAGFIDIPEAGLTRSIPNAAMQALMQIITALVSVYLIAYIIEALAPSFYSEKNAGKSLQLAVYSCTAQWVAGSMLIIPGLKWISILAGFYVIYLLATGIPVMKNTSQDKVTGYTVLVVISMLIILSMLTLMLGAFMKLIF